MPKVTKKKYLNSQGAREYLGIKNLNTLYGYIQSGKLKAYKLGPDGEHNRRHYRFTMEDLDNFITGKK